MKYRMKAMFFVYILLLATISFTPGECDTKVFNLKDYGAVQGGNVDISQALLKAWGDACNWKGGSKLEVPSATYLVNPVILKGPCRGPIEFHNSGTLKGPQGLRGDSLIEFQYIDGLTLNGGVFDGQGPPKQAAPGLPTLLRFTFITNSRAQLVKLINSQSTHFHLFGCKQIVIDQISISSPENSPNTDGIKIGESNVLRIVSSKLAFLIRITRFI
ncbi:polygalacturonase-like [Silene latifolia]|uniref:polygalacturonase-like n=1 Tax=Silene latifolia TaxID=37657 RepID=UPI003D773D7D